MGRGKRPETRKKREINRERKREREEGEEKGERQREGKGDRQGRKIEVERVTGRGKGKGGERLFCFILSFSNGLYCSWNFSFLCLLTIFIGKGLDSATIQGTPYHYQPCHC